MLNSLPELLAPVGDYERLVTAIYYGADAVYLGSDQFGMRTAAASFGGEELKKACDYAHEHNVKVYLTCNTVPRNSEIEKLPSFLEYASYSGVDALIVTDIGVLNLVKKYVPDVDVHISTQAGITNYASATEFYNLGAKRIVTARELSLDEIITIREKCPKELEIECFVHGAMCVSFSGRCLLSNYLTGRDSNRGDCAQPCRWKYSIVEEKRPGQYFPVNEDSSGTFFLNSRDMCMIDHIPELCYAGINSFKIEGRAKSSYYVAVTVNAYRSAMNSFAESGFEPDYITEEWIRNQIMRSSNRQYCTGFYFSDPSDDAQIFYDGGYVREWDVIGVTEDYRDGKLYASQRNRFFEGDEIEVMLKGSEPLKLKVKNLCDENGEHIESAPHPLMKFSVDCPVELPAGLYLQKIRTE